MKIAEVGKVVIDFKSEEVKINDFTFVNGEPGEPGVIIQRIILDRAVEILQQIRGAL